MQRERVPAGGNNWQISECASIANEFVRELGFDVAFIHAGLYEAQDAPESFFSDFAGLADEGEFMLGLRDAKLVHHAGKPLVIVQWITAKRFANETGFTRFDFDDGPLMLVRIEVNMLGFAHEAMKQDRELREPLDILNARDFARLVFCEFVAFPELTVGGRFAQKKNLAMLFVVGVGV